MQSRMFPSLLALAAALGSTEALAQVDSFSLNFGKIEYEYRSARTGGLPFAIDLVLGEQGSVALRPNIAHNLTFKRGQFFPADPLPQAWLGFELSHMRTGRIGDLSVMLDQRGGGGGPHVKVFNGNEASGASAHTGGVQILMSDGSVRFIRDSIDVTLRGEPASLFNQPGPGEPLEARLPTPAPGQTLMLTLRITDDRGARTQIPVRIRNGD